MLEKRVMSEVPMAPERILLALGLVPTLPRHIELEGI